jgi:hypothetical protein
VPIPVIRSVPVAGEIDCRISARIAVRSGLRIHRERLVDIRFETRIAQGRDKGVEDISDCARNRLAFGKRPWVGLVVEGTLTIELKPLEDVVGRG